MKALSIAGRACWANSPASPTRCIVVLHASAMTALEMYGCVLGNQPDTDVLFIFPSSEHLTHWDYRSTETPDFQYLAELDSEICAKYPTVQSVALAGFSNGGFMSSLIAANALYAYDSFTLVCATLPVGVSVSANALPCSVTIVYGLQDILVPASGSKSFLSPDSTQSAFEAAGFTVPLSPFEGGHCWPGGVAPPSWTQKLMGPWATTPSATQMIIQSVKGE